MAKLVLIPDENLLSVLKDTKSVEDLKKNFHARLLRDFRGDSDPIYYFFDYGVKVWIGKYGAPVVLLANEEGNKIYNVLYPNEIELVRLCREYPVVIHYVSQQGKRPSFPVVGEKALYTPEKFRSVLSSVEWDEDIARTFGAYVLGRADDVFPYNPYGYRAWVWYGVYADKPIVIVAADGVS